MIDVELLNENYNIFIISVQEPEWDDESNFYVHQDMCALSGYKITLFNQSFSGSTKMIVLVTFGSLLIAKQKEYNSMI